MKLEQLSSSLFPYTTLFRSANGRSPSPGVRSAAVSHGASAPSSSRCRRRRVAAARSGSPASRSSPPRSEEHTSELQSQSKLVCRLLLEKKKELIRVGISQKS